MQSCRRGLAGAAGCRARVTGRGLRGAGCRARAHRLTTKHSARARGSSAVYDARRRVLRRASWLPTLMSTCSPEAASTRVTMGTRLAVIASTCAQLLRQPRMEASSCTIAFCWSWLGAPPGCCMVRSMSAPLALSPHDEDP